MSDDEEEGFRLVELDCGRTVGRFSALDEIEGFVHAVTTRDTFDVDLIRDDPQTAGRDLGELLNLSGIAYCRQVHGNTILLADKPGLLGDADSLVTDAPSLGLMGFSADCPIVLIADPTTGAVGMGHASWRGTVRGISSKLVGGLIEQFAVNPEDLRACISPSAGACCYEVGTDVLETALAEIGSHAQGFFQTRGGKIYFDLPRANREELIEGGVLPQHVHLAGLCTICRNDLFPSYRAEGFHAGRFAAIIARKG